MKNELNYSNSTKFEAFVQSITSNNQREFYGFWEKIKDLGINTKPLEELEGLDQIRFIYELEKNGIPVKFFQKELGKYAYTNTSNSRIPKGASGILKLDIPNNSIVFMTIEKDYIVFLPKGGKFKSFDKILSFLGMDKLGTSKGLSKKIEAHRIALNTKKSISQLTREIATAKIAGNTAKIAKKSIETGNYKEAKEREFVLAAQKLGYKLVPASTIEEPKKPQLNVGNGFVEPTASVGRKQIVSGYDPKLHDPRIEIGESLPELPELQLVELVDQQVKKNNRNSRKEKVNELGYGVDA